jgi:hypothetical protein
MDERAATVRLWKTPWEAPWLGRQYCFIFPLLGKGASQCPGCEAEQNGDSHQKWLQEWFMSDPTERHNAAKMTNLSIKFFSRRYWKRRWILQELAFAKKQLLYWGGCVMDVSNFPKDWLKDFALAVKMIIQGLHDAPSFPAVDWDPGWNSKPLMQRLGDLSQFCTPQTNGNYKAPTWISRLSAFESSECSDARDMYYALASMIAPRIRVDYTLTQAEVFVNFAKMMLGLGEWEWVFRCATESAMATDADQMEIRNACHLPTWVPDPRLVVNYQFNNRDISPPMNIQILEENALLCDVRCVGVLHKSSHGTELQWDQLFWQIYSSHRALDANQSIE